jgi:hypothetical protein
LIAEEYNYALKWKHKGVGRKSPAVIDLNMKHSTLSGQ